MNMKLIIEIAILDVLADPALEGRPINVRRLRELAVPRLDPQMRGEIRAHDLVAHQFLQVAKGLAHAGRLIASPNQFGEPMFNALARSLPVIHAESLDLPAGGLEELHVMKELLDDHGEPMTAAAIVDLCDSRIGSGVVSADRQAVLVWLRARVIKAALRGILVDLSFAASSEPEGE